MLAHTLRAVLIILALSLAQAAWADDWTLSLAGSGQNLPPTSLTTAGTVTVNGQPLNWTGSLTQTTATTGTVSGSLASGQNSLSFTGLLQAFNPLWWW